ncbi:C25 family cysteine peptidase [Pseudomonadota bacterium]
MLGATVYLYRIVGGQPQLFGMTTTDVSGDYDFTGLPPGEYRVEVDISGTVVDGQQQTADPDELGDVCSVCDSQTTVTIVDMDIVDLDFGFWNGDTETTPVTLGYFHATGGGGWLRIDWATATETGNLGFNLYVVDPDGSKRQINAELIPSKVIDSMKRQKYSFEATGVSGDEFVIEDVDVLGKTRMRGPFVLDKVYGRLKQAGRKIDWKSIRSEHKAKKKARKQKKREKMRDKVKRKKRELETSDAGSWLNRAVAVAASLFIGVANAADVPVKDTGLLNLEVTEQGLHRVTHEELVAAGVDLTGARATRIGLTVGGEAVPVRVYTGSSADGKSGKTGKTGSKKDRFGPGGYIEWFGEPLDSLYTKANVYVLQYHRNALQAEEEYGEAPAGAAASHYLQTDRVEDDAAYSYGAPNGDPWYAEWLMAISGPVTKNYAVTLDNYAAGGAPVTLSVGLWGVTDFPEEPDHHVKVSLNTTEVTNDEGESWLFDGKVDLPIEVAVPEGLLSEGSNTLTLDLPHDTGALYDVVALDHYEVTYPRRFVARGGGLSFSADGDAFEVEGLPGDEVVVHRIGTDGSTEYLTDIEVFADGSGTYTARFAGSYDGDTYHVSAVSALHTPEMFPPQDETDIASGTASYLIITHPDFMGSTLDQLVSKREAQGYTVKVVDVEDIYAQFGFAIPGARSIKDYIAYAYDKLDTRMVLLLGGDIYDYHGYLGEDAISFVPTLYAQTDEIILFSPVDALYADVDDDNVPDVAIGRLPLRTTTELETWLNKSVAWEQRTYENTAVLAADRYDTDQEYSFSDDSDNLITSMPAGWSVTKAYLDDDTLANTKEKLLTAIEGGVSLTSFFGHSYEYGWSFDDLLSWYDVVDLQNSSLPTVVTQWGCWNTYYVLPYEDTLGHEFLLNGDRGAVAVLGASTLTEASAEREISTLLFDYLLVPGMTMGDAILQAKRDYAEVNPDQFDIILGWTLLGDPALIVAQP